MLACVLLFAGAAALGLVSVAAVGTGGLLSGEEVSVSVVDVVALPAHLQPSPYATNFGGHVHYWVFSHLDPSFDLFYGRRWKALAMALLAPLVYLTLRRRLDCRPGPAALGAATAVLLPGVSALAWLATENGLEALWGLGALLLVTSRWRAWWLAPVLAGVSVSTYGAGLAWAAPVLAVAALRVLRSPSRLRDAALLLGGVTAGVVVVLLPLLWWDDGGRIVVGGGDVESADVPDALGDLFGELAVRGDSYYYFTSSPALGSAVLAAVVLVALVLGTALRRRLWPWTLVVLATVVLYAAAGGLLGVRRTIALPILGALALGVLADLVVRHLRGRWQPAAVLVVAALAVAVPLAVQYAGWRTAWEAGRIEIPQDFDFPIPPGRTMTEVVEDLTARLRSGEAPEQVTQGFEAKRALAMVWMLADRRGEDLTGLLTPREITR